MPVRDLVQTLTEALCWLFMCDATYLENNDFLYGIALGETKTALDFGFRCPLGYEGMKAAKHQSTMECDTIARPSHQFTTPGTSQ